MEKPKASPPIFHVAVNLFVDNREAADAFLQSLNPPGKEEGLLIYFAIREKLEGDEAREALENAILAYTLLNKGAAVG